MSDLSESTINPDTGEITRTTTSYFWKTPFNHDTDAEALRVGLVCLDPSLAQQHAKDETDINVIVDRFLKTGTVPQIPVPPTYEEFAEVFDFQTAMNIIAAGKHSFSQLPAEVRDAFRNDPGRFVGQVDAWLAEEDPKKRASNLETMRALNLAVEPGPIADRTTLGDVLKAIKEQGAHQAPPDPHTGPKGP